MLRSFTQNDEQQVILRELAHIKEGNFLDIGAHDGESMSNSRALALLGWRGTLVEPNPCLFLNLLGRYREDSRFTLINSAMSNQSGLANFSYDGSKNQYSSSLAENAQELFPATHYIAKYKVNAISPADLTGEVFDFVSIDTEGHDLPILRAFRGMLNQTTLVCIEFNHTDIKGTTNILEELNGQGFAEIHRTRENILAKR
jgi:FkbM family methyltransferase